MTEQHRLDGSSVDVVSFDRPETPAAALAAVDPAAVFTQLVREVDAGRALIAMTPHGERHRAAADALALCRDVLTDARDLFGSCACGAVELLGEPATIAPGAAQLVHAPAACVLIDPATGEQL